MPATRLALSARLHLCQQLAGRHARGRGGRKACQAAAAPWRTGAPDTPSCTFTVEHGGCRNLQISRRALSSAGQKEGDPDPAVRTIRLRFKCECTRRKQSSGSKLPKI